MATGAKCAQDWHPHATSFFFHLVRVRHWGPSEVWRAHVVRPNANKRIKAPTLEEREEGRREGGEGGGGKGGGKGGGGSRGEGGEARQPTRRTQTRRTTAATKHPTPPEHRNRPTKTTPQEEERGREGGKTKQPAKQTKDPKQTNPPQAPQQPTPNNQKERRRVGAHV
jgi:hypothetical protein